MLSESHKAEEVRQYICTYRRWQVSKAAVEREGTYINVEYRQAE